MISPLSYLAAQEHIFDLARTAGREGLAGRVVPHRGRVGWLSRVLVELRRRAHGQAAPTEPGHPAAVVDSSGRPA